MKKLLFSFTASILLMGIAKGENPVPNNDLSNWHDNYLYDELEVWETNNDIGHITGSEFTPVEIIEHEGEDATSVRLKPFEALDQYMPGQLVQGTPDQAGNIDDGIPIDEAPNSVEVTYRSTFSDEAFSEIQLFLTYDEEELDDDQSPELALPIELPGDQDEFVTISEELDHPEEYPEPEQVAITVFAFDPRSGHIELGQYLELKSINFKGNDEEIPNGNFEQWEALSVEEPENWTTMNSLIADSIIVEKIDDAEIGDHAFKLGSRFQESTESTSSFAMAGEIIIEEENHVHEGFPLEDDPVKLGGHYKYHTQEDDTAKVSLFVNDEEGKTTDTQEFVLEPTEDYSPFEFDIEDVPKSTEEAIVNLSSTSDNNAYFSELIIDNIYLETTSAHIDLMNTGQDDMINPYPNPATNKVNLDLPDTEQANEVKLIDAQGKEVIHKELTNGRDDRAQIDVSTLPAGIYSYQISTDKNEHQGRLVVE